VVVGHGRSSPWWREIVGIRDKVGEVAERGWLEEGVERRVGNRLETLFWSNPWVEGSRLVRGFNACLNCPFTRPVRLWRCGI
jgi:hypothetical protein